MMELLATGITGTIGRYLPPEANSLFLDLGAKSSKFLDLPISKNSHLLHLAGMVGLQKCEDDPSGSYQINVEGTQNLAAAFAKKSSGTFVFISSGRVYNSGPPKSTEESEVSPSTQYAKHKLEAETQIKAIFQSQPERLMILRVFSILGWNTREGSLGATVTKAINAGRLVEIPHSEDVRDFLPPDSVAQTLLQIMKSGPVHGTFNLCTGQGLSVEKAVRKMCLERGASTSNIRFLPGNSPLPYLVGDNSKLMEAYPQLRLNWGQP